MSDTMKPVKIDDCDMAKDSLTADDTAEDESDELFSDDDQKKEIKCNFDTSLHISISNRSETSLLPFGDSSLNAIHSSDPTIPSTPLSLLPFLNKINEQWTADLETPQAQPHNAKVTTSTAKKTEETPKQCEQFSPDVKSVDKVISNSPVIVSRVVRKCPKRRIFKSSVDPLTNNEDLVVDVKVESLTPEQSTNSITRDDAPSVSISSADNVLKYCESKVCKIQEICNSEESEKLKSTDNLNTSTQDFFNNASFSNVDQLCSNNFDDKQATTETIENKGNAEVGENVGFFTARGTSINVSRKALSKAKRLFADAFADEVQAKNDELSAKKNSIEPKHLPFSSFADSASISIAKEVLSKPKLQFTEQLKNYDKTHTAESRKRFANKSPVKDAIPILFSTASGAPINISKEALSKAKALLADEDHSEDVSVKDYEKSLKDKSFTKQSSTSNKSISLSEKSLPKTRLVFAEYLSTAYRIEPSTSNKVDNSDNDQCDLKALNVGFQTASGKAINISEQALSKAKALLAEHIEDPLELNVIKETDNDELKRQETKISNIGCHIIRDKLINVSEKSNTAKEIKVYDKKMKESEDSFSNIEFQMIRDRSTYDNTFKKVLSTRKLSFSEQLDEIESQSLKSIIARKTKVYDKVKNKQEIKVPSIGFQTARGTSISISEEALSRAKALFADQFDHPSEMDISENVDRDNEKTKKCEEKISNIGFQTARGTSISISEEALSRAKALFADQFDHPSEMDISENVDRDNEKTKKCEEKISNIGFQTARGTSISISKEALSRAKALFADQFDHPSEIDISENVDRDNEETKKCEEKISNVGFQTARGTSISISKEALSKAKALFADQFDHPSEIDISENVDRDNEETKKCKEKISNVGFQTARGTSISISKEALSRAKALFADQFDHPSEIDISENVDRDNEETKKCEEKISNVGFQTARGTSISKEALSRAKALFADQFDHPSEIDISENVDRDNEETKKCEEKISNVGFQTARGTSISISKEALSRAKALFADQFDHPSEIDISENVDRDNEETKKCEEKISNVGFQTARGTSISISKEALSRAKALFADQFDHPSEIDISENIDCDNEETKKCEEKISNVGFQTARGTSISKEALSRAKALFADQFDHPSEMDISENVDRDNEETKKCEEKISNIGFQTARGTSINISEEALSRAKALFADQFDHPSEMDISLNMDCDDEKIKKRNVKVLYDDCQIANNQRIITSNSAPVKMQELSSRDYVDKNISDNALTLFQKRKLSENTPLGTNHESELKKTRFSNKLARRLSFNNLIANTNNRKDSTTSKDPCVTRKKIANTNADDECIRNVQACCSAELSNIVTNTINLGDEKKQISPITDVGLGSPERGTEQSIELDATSSPVIGRKPISRKRKSFKHRRDRVPAEQMVPNDENVPPGENIVPRSAPCEEIDNQKSDAGTQMTEKQSHNAESNEYGDTQMMMHFIDESAKILQNRLAAALEQEEAITAKRRRGSCKQLTGHLYRQKQTNGRSSLRQIANGAPPASRSHQELIDRRIPPNILAISAASAASYKFRCSDFYGSDVARDNVRGIEMEDGARLILDENGYVGVWEFLRAFLASPGVDPNLVPARWVENHYRWIVWKLASMDRMKFGTLELPRTLTPARVMAQLKYRYDREIDRSQRPAIRRILEKDDVASKRMILCVSSIVQNNDASTESMGKSPRLGVPKWKMELTDGWYSVAASIDIDLARVISKGRIREGTKLVVSGAELLNCDQACYPLEAPSDVCLKLHANSTRRARWHAKLGYASRSGPIPVKLRHVCANGGLIGEMTVTIARVYPMLYHERTASGDSVVRNAKCEEKAQSKYEQQCWAKIEAFYANAEEDFQRDDLSGKTAGMTIELSDCENLSTEEFASKKQRDEFVRELHLREEKFKQDLQSRLRASLPAPRQVSTLLKVRVCDQHADAILAIWSPSEEVVDALKEGTCVSLGNVVAAGKRGFELQLNARRSAIFRPAKMRDASYPARVCTPFCEIANSKFAPPYGEFDTVGFICSVGPAPYGMKDFEVVHLAWPTEADSSPSYLSILFWQGIASFGYAEILTVGSVVASSNLEWRRATSWNIPVAYCTERSTFTCNPRRDYLCEPLENLRNLITEPVKYVERYASELNAELQKKSTPMRYTPGKNTPNKIFNSGSSVDKSLVDYTSPLSRLGSGSSSFIAANSSIQRRLDKLRHYGDAPELSPIVLRKSKKLSLEFKSPVRILDATENASSTDRSNNPDPSDAPQE